MAAAVLWSIENGDDFPQALSWGVAAGTASAKLPGIQFATLEQASAVRKDIDLRRVEA
jgi:fructose-1-phosphate kinase PfkB-like protein